MTVQHVIFWRHAEADELDVPPGSARDMERALTRTGQRDAIRVAAWIKTHLPKPRLVVSSPALRARQTALALTDDPLLDPRLAPDTSADQLLRALDEHGRDCAVLVLVGHQPHIGRAALRWISGCDTAFGLRKGGLIWCASRDRSDGNARILRAAITPDLVD